MERFAPDDLPVVFEAAGAEIHSGEVPRDRQIGIAMTFPSPSKSPSSIRRCCSLSKQATVAYSQVFQAL